MVCDCCGGPLPPVYPVWYAWTDGTEFRFCRPACRKKAQVDLNIRFVDETESRGHMPRWSRR